MSEPEEHRAIWLEPRCTDEAGEDRCWSQSDEWVTCEECGLPSVKYIIATEYEALVKALEEIDKHMDGIGYSKKARRIARAALAKVQS